MQRNCVTVYCLYEEKLKLSRDTPSSILHLHFFYNLSDFYQQLLTAHSEALLYMMNNSGIMGTTIRLRNTPISSFIQHNYRGIVKELWRYFLLFMKQLVNVNDNQTLTFYDYCVRLDIPQATKYPSWFDTLQTALLSNSSSRETIASFPHIVSL
ncbi:20133_t:CDS:2, partial [Funneliformis geosporum]